MSVGATGVGTAAAVAAAIAQAIKASGVLVSIEPASFVDLLLLEEHPLVVVAPRGWRGRKFRYLCGIRGLAFYTDTDEPLELPPEADLISAGKIWIPG